MKAGAIARRPPVTISPGASIREAARIMAERKIGFLPVVSEGRLVGAVSERDLVAAVAAGAPPETPVEAVMRDKVPTINYNDDVEGAWYAMKAADMRHLVVVKGEEVYGVISIRDFLAERLILNSLVK